MTPEVAADIARLVRKSSDVQLSKPAGIFVAGLCAYEVFALTTGRVPTVSAFCRRYWWCAALVELAWDSHIHSARQAEQAG